jgi:hypothetical protein
VEGSGPAPFLERSAAGLRHRGALKASPWAETEGLSPAAVQALDHVLRWLGAPADRVDSSPNGGLRFGPWPLGGSDLALLLAQSGLQLPGFGHAPDAEGQLALRCEAGGRPRLGAAAERRLLQDPALLGALVLQLRRPEVQQRMQSLLRRRVIDPVLALVGRDQPSARELAVWLGLTRLGGLGLVRSAWRRVQGEERRMEALVALLDQHGKERLSRYLRWTLASPELDGAGIRT